ncbi:MAG: branched-chain amino acid transaminase [Gemmatimonadaceae bacterium]|nr:branched-chain amino acid transaminase [Gemmatimonadaceae bacterium]
MGAPATGRTKLIWRDGNLVPWEEATLHVMSHVVHYGSSVFEGMRCYRTPSGGAIFRAREHLRRLMDSARIYRMDLPYSADELVTACIETVRANGLDECYLRPIVVRTGEQMGILATNSPLEVFIIAWQWGTYLGAEAVAQGADVCVSSWRRFAPDTMPALAKAGGNYLNAQLSKGEARQNGYVEGIMLDSTGYVAEGSGENLFAIRDGVIHTAPVASGILNGITRDSIIRIARDFGYEVRETVMPREFLYIADELFFCGTAAEMTPIRSVDRIPVGEGRPGPITLRLQQEYMGLAKGTLEDRYGWRTEISS